MKKKDIFFSLNSFLCMVEIFRCIVYKISLKIMGQFWAFVKIKLS